jgi:hypothetical protein
MYTIETFYPTKLVADMAGNLYVVTTGCFEGAVIFDKDYNFSGYFGATKVRATPWVVVQNFWKKIMSSEQKSKMARVVPIEYVSIDIDKKDFIYTTTVTLNFSEQIRKLNPKGDSILPDDVLWGDYDGFHVKGKTFITQFNDICVDADGFFFALDFNANKVVQYDSEGKQMCVFGSAGTQKGTFKQPIAIDTLDDRVLVLDIQKNSITVFEPTEYGSLLRQAIVLYNNGRYEEASGPWKEVQKRDANLCYAYQGLGDSEMYLGNYKQAMDFYSQGRTWMTPEKWSEAYKQYRLNLMRDKFGLVVLIVILAPSLLFLISKRKWIMPRLAKIFRFKGKESVGA